MKPKRAPRAPAAKNDPKHVTMARELRDRFLEYVNGNEARLLGAGKYEVGRLLEVKEIVRETRLLEQAA